MGDMLLETKSLKRIYILKICDKYISFKVYEVKYSNFF